MLSEWHGDSVILSEWQDAADDAAGEKLNAGHADTIDFW